LILDEGEGVFLGGVHRATNLHRFYKNSSTISRLCLTS
jgi:hypothetical protein